MTLGCAWLAERVKIIVLIPIIPLLHIPSCRKESQDLQHGLLYYEM